MWFLVIIIITSYHYYYHHHSGGAFTATNVCLSCVFIVRHASSWVRGAKYNTVYGGKLCFLFRWLYLHDARWFIAFTNVWHLFEGNGVATCVCTHEYGPPLAQQLLTSTRAARRVQHKD